MSDYFTGEIRLFANSFIIYDWLPCNHTLLPINQFTRLYSLIGNTFGGDGSSTFNLPALNYSGRVPIGTGKGSGLSFVDLGQTGGENTSTLTEAQIPPHTHNIYTVRGSNRLNASPSNMLSRSWNSEENSKPFLTPAVNPDLSLHPDTIGNTGWASPHENCQPYLYLNYYICTYGYYPDNV